MGQKLRQKRKKNNNIKCFAILFFCVLPISISSEMSICVSSLWWQTSEFAQFAQCWTVQLSAWRLLRRLTSLLFHSFLLEFTYLFIQIDSVGQAEPTVWIPFLAEEKIERCCLWGLALVKACCVVYRWTMCMTLHYFFFFFFWSL